MLKKIILIIFGMLVIGSFTGVKAAGIEITANPTSAKVGDTITITIKVTDTPENAGLTNLYITNMSASTDVSELKPYLKQSFNPYKDGKSSTYTYTWDTQAAGSVAGNYSIVVLVLDKDIVYDQNPQRFVLLSSGPYSVDLISTDAADNTDQTEDTQNKTDSKTSNSSFLGTILPPGNSADWTIDDIPTMISNIIKLALALAGGIAVIFILIGAFQYFTAFGNEEKATKGKTTVTYAIIGVVVILLAELIVYLVRNLIG